MANFLSATNLLQRHNKDVKEMIVRTMNQKEIARFFQACHKLAAQELDEEFEKNANDGRLLSPYPSDSPFAGDLGYFGSAAINQSTNPMGYETGSGMGTYFISYVPEEKNGESKIVAVLNFVGRRNSFKDGAGYLGFTPSQEADWEVVSSQEPNRGAFD